MTSAFLEALARTAPPDRAGKNDLSDASWLLDLDTGNLRDGRERAAPAMAFRLGAGRARGAGCLMSAARRMRHGDATQEQFLWHDAAGL